MKKLLLSITLGAFLLGGISIFSSTPENFKNIAAGGEKEPSILSISKAA
ncbi:hypothetical protein B4102_0144 [Heyndrickxia sporothermodurans]|uniref:Phr family secreted Rap phosphatase inhibitor n=1 Tax=Heyndrickxia sporothermodurans TaxID=46224 RepID=A0A150LD32_9BACI|nr:hypothetical protein [Heyndrickxia sporothermodurans]KYD10238.1 hypothetical protein B4102_0144 [Heyndrickxia sporothermodurans]